ncbi:monovalent cation/H+ antiporter subunit D family protein [Kineococcus terrestris]|uniref:monovalent cation/H+ antiporter subunit D family protein n=1 Tax=Kineococcus terrestris TaxID=2044856 RepID=UPI0034DAC27C
MSGTLLPLLVAVPLVVGGLLVALPDRLLLGRLLLLGTTGGSTAAGAALVVSQLDGGVVAHRIGLWPAGIAIPFAADMLTALMLTVTGLLTTVCALFAIASGEAARRFFPPLVVVLTAGVNGALLTGDLFNLFVFIEVMLLPSYALLVMAAPRRGTTSRVAGARLYVTVNLLTSTIFLAGVGLLYGVTGSVNMADVAGAAQTDGRAAVAAAVCLLALSIKAAVVPVHGWLARAYPAASPAVTAMFSGLHTKVAIYAVYRIYAVVFGGDERWLWVGVLLFSATMVVGVLGAVGEGTTRSILAFHMVSQIGYILLGVALFGPLGLAAGIFYLLHHMIVKASLFLSTGAVEVRYGTHPLGAVRGIARTEPLVAVAFFAAALSLAGIPPFSGFVAKFSLVQAAVAEGQLAAAVVAVAVSLFTLLSMLKIWSAMFWGEPAAPGADPGSGGRASGPALGGADGARGAAPTAVATRTREETTAETDPRPASTPTATARPARRIGLALALPGVVLAVVTLGLGLGGQLLMSLAQVAAEGLLDPTPYLEAVTSS